MPESRKLPTWGYEVLKEGNENVIRINVEDWPYVPSIEDNALVMALTIDKLVEVPSVHRIVFVQRKNYVYDYAQTQMLLEIALLYNRLVKQKRALSAGTLGLPGVSEADVPRRHGIIQYLVFNLLRSDPLGAYAEVKRIIREENIRLKRVPTPEEQESEQMFIDLLENIKGLLEKTKLVDLAKPYLEGYKIGDRSIYALFFKPAITPDFFFTRLMAQMPTDGEQLDIYPVGNAEVTMLRIPEDIKILYHLNPPEFKLTEDKYELLDLARRVVAEHQPKAEEFLEPEKVRQTFFNIGKDLITELAEQRNIELKYEEIEELTNILVRYTVGFGLIEVLLEDQKVQDLTINGPIGVTPIFLVHDDYEECVTNIIPSRTDAESWASKFRMLSGRPLDEANPVLDTELILPKARARVAIIQNPLNPFGLAYALRRHRDKPWTLPLFIQNGMISPLGAGLMSFLIDGARTLLIAGTRSSGKCVSGNTLVQLSDGNILHIKDMVKGEENQVDNDLVYKDDKPPAIISLEGYNLKSINLSDYWKRRIDKKLVKIKTKSGKEIITTEEHPYFTFDRGIKPVFAGFIKKGQFIATPRKIKIEGKKQIINLKSPDTVLDKGDHYIIKGATNSNPVKFPKHMSKEFAEFLGYLLADGHIDKCEVSFFNSNQSLREKYKKLISIFDVNFKERKDRTTWFIQISSRILSRALSETFDIPLGKKSDKVKIPKEILMSDKEVLSSFLKAYADSDGYIPDGKKDLEICTKSKLMSQQLQLVFLRYGIVSFCKKKVVNGENYYRILIRGSFVNKYAKHVGFSHPLKLARLEKIVENNTLENTNVDIIPQGDCYLRELRKRLRVVPKQLRTSTGKDYWAYENKEYRVTRKWFKKIVAFYQTRYESLKRDSLKIEELTGLVKFQEEYSNSMLMFDKLKNLLSVPYTELAKRTSFSETWLRKILQKNRQVNLQDLNSMAGAYSLLENKWFNLKLALNLEENVHCLKQWVENTPLTYASLAKEIGVSESMLKGYAYGGFKIPSEKEKILVRHLNCFKGSLVKNLEQSEMLLKNLGKNFNNHIISYTELSAVLKELKNELNIKNYELTSEDLSIQTVSNFFNSKFKNSSFKTVNKIARKIVEVYNESLSDETKKILNTAKDLSKSDIFWDEVIHIEEINSDEEWVYDLTVPETHNFVANGIIAHNTSMLGAHLVEIMRKYRVITVEDTLELPGEALRKLGYNIQPMKVRSALMAGGTEVPADEGIRTSLRMGDSSLIVGEIRSSLRGDEEVVIIENGETKRIKIESLENKNLKNILVPTLDKNLKVELTKLTGFVKHPKRKKLLKITTSSNREVTVTHDHSVFTSKNFKIYPIETQKLSIGDQIVLPAKMPLGYNNISYLNLLDFLPELRLTNAESYIRKAIAKVGWKKASEICNTIDIYAYLRRPKVRANLPIKYFKELMKKTNIYYKIDNFKIKTGTSQEIPAKFKINEDFSRFLGYYIAEGNIGKNTNTIQITNSEKKVREDIKLILKSLNLNHRTREIKGIGKSTQMIIDCSPLAKLLLKLGAGRISSEKRIPSFIYGLSEKKICALLKGVYTGDGSFTASKSSGNAVRYHTTSKKLAEDVMYLLLTMGVVARLETKKMSKTSIGKKPVYNVTFKQREFVKLFFQKIGFNRDYVPKAFKKGVEHTKDNSVRFDIKEVEKHLKLPRKYRHIRRYSQCSKDYLKKIASETKCSKQFEDYTYGEFYLDTIKEIKEITLPEEEHVYDLSVNPTENFIGGFGGIVLHNTEAFALYEAMRIGALANVVAGTIHGDSPYGVFDRVVNDLKVPTTSFKATDIILMCNPIKSPDGLKKWRRAMSITEVRKHWSEDPIREQGFVDLMKYNTKNDQLEPTDDLINGDSEILKSIAGNIKEWAGDWDAVWDNITLRAKTKETLLNYSNKAKDLGMLEAEFVVLANDRFHRVCEMIKEEVGALDSKRIFFEWEEWLKRKVRERKRL